MVTSYLFDLLNVIYNGEFFTVDLSDLALGEEFADVFANHKPCRCNLHYVVFVYDPPAVDCVCQRAL